MLDDQTHMDSFEFEKRMRLLTLSDRPVCSYLAGVYNFSARDDIQKMLLIYYPSVPKGRLVMYHRVNIIQYKRYLIKCLLVVELQL